jgi:hypothetical protein
MKERRSEARGQARTNLHGAKIWRFPLGLIILSLGHFNDLFQIDTQRQIAWKGWEH